MDHSSAIMEDAGAVVEAAAKSVNREDQDKHDEPNDQQSEHHAGERKRKRSFGDATMRHGGRSNNQRHPKGNMGRSEYFRNQPDKRQKNQQSREKRQANGDQGYGKQFSKEEIDADEKKPKRKVAVMIGYSGTGYKGMQISPSEKTIEGDLFNAFIAAGAISKANADDPKKVSLVRCARTDKGVHAAGNMISLKLIVEDPEVVEKINANLPPQIRVWGIERTINSFSCYQACDSRWYEYLIPSHAFLPPHPSSWLAKKLEELAGNEAERAAYNSRQEEVKAFWEQVEENDIKLILENIDQDIRFDVVKALQGEDEASAKTARFDLDEENLVKIGGHGANADDGDDLREETTETAAIVLQKSGTSSATADSQLKHLSDMPGNDGVAGQRGRDSDSTTFTPFFDDHSAKVDTHANISITGEKSTLPPTEDRSSKLEDPEITISHLPTEEQERFYRLRTASRQLRAAYTTAKRRYRIPAQRIKRIQDTLNQYVGTLNYHNYTIQKSHKDPSAKRHIKSFVVNPSPILIGQGDDSEKTEWLSLKVHGQSFMMHQIRKMVGMAALHVRCGADPATLRASFGSNKFSIPKVPGLGLLLERPVFDSYNKIQAVKHQRQPLLFSHYEKELEEFKEREIYQRIFREEELKNEFGRFFNHIDNFKEPYFLYITSQGWSATQTDR